jgi:5-methylcytosine-specific restriction endonuclease McrA
VAAEERIGVLPVGVIAAVLRDRDQQRAALCADIRHHLREWAALAASERLEPLAHGDLWHQLEYEANTVKIELGDLLQAARRRRKKITPALRRSVFRRDGFRCTECGWQAPLRDGEEVPRRDPHQPFLTVGHRVPSCEGGPPTLANLATQCSDCNQRMGRSLAALAPEQEAP